LQNSFSPLLAGCPRNDYFLCRVRIDEVDGGQLVDGVVHLADGQPVQLELNFNFNFLILFQLPRVHKKVGQSERNDDVLSKCTPTIFSALNFGLFHLFAQADIYHQ